jgi:hypothetical protein
MLLLHESDSVLRDLSPDEMQKVIQRYIAWRQRVQDSGRQISGHKLADGEGRVLRGNGSAARVTDGPYAEAREVIGGLFIVDAGSYEEAVTLSRDCPHLEFGTIEIRRIEPTA